MYVCHCVRSCGTGLITTLASQCSGVQGFLAEAATMSPDINTTSTVPPQPLGCSFFYIIVDLKGLNPMTIHDGFRMILATWKLPNCSIHV